MRDRHLEYFLAFALAAEDALWGPQQREWLDRVESEIHNFRHAVEWCLESGAIAAGLRLGSGITVGPECSAEELETRRREIRETPERFVAQDIVPLSTLPTLVDGSFAPSHVDLRAFVLQRPDEQDASRTVAVTAPGAMTRVAPAGTMIVNVSAGGGAKDTWIQR